MHLKETQAVILVGGLGTRLKPYTETVPKPMIEINEKPFLEYKIEQVKKFGVENLVFCVGYLGEKVEEYFGNGKKFGVNINYSYEKELLGTAGAVKNAERLINSDFFIVMNGDTYIPINLSGLINFHFRNTYPITMSVTHATNPNEQELIKVENGIVSQFFKRGTSEHKNYLEENNSPLINAGVYVFDKNVLSSIPRNKKVSLEQEIFPQFVGKMNSFHYEGYMKDLTNIQFCRELEKYLQENK